MMKHITFNKNVCNLLDLCNLCVTLVGIVNTIAVYIYITITIYIYTQLHRYTNRTILWNITNKYYLVSIIQIFRQLIKKINSYVYTGRSEKRCNCVTFGQKRTRYTLWAVTFSLFGVYIQNINVISRHSAVTFVFSEKR